MKKKIRFILLLIVITTGGILIFLWMYIKETKLYRKLRIKLKRKRNKK